MSYDSHMWPLRFAIYWNFGQNPQKWYKGNDFIEYDDLIFVREHPQRQHCICILIFRSSKFRQCIIIKSLSHVSPLSRSMEFLFRQSGCFFPIYFNKPYKHNPLLPFGVFFISSLLKAAAGIRLNTACPQAILYWPKAFDSLYQIMLDTLSCAVKLRNTKNA